MHVLQSNKQNFNETRLVNVPENELKDGEVRVKVERFSFTANNATYAVLGDYLKYWQFFPAASQSGDDDSNQWGIIPVWGFAVVSESRCNEVAVGARFFGYFPPAERWVMTPSNVSHGSFVDATAHRQALPAGYNLYRAAEPKTDKIDAEQEQTDNERSLLYPLFVTSYCIHDLMSGRDWLGADQVLIISASSKTSIGLAYAIQDDESSPTALGLTSDRNKADVTLLGLYEQVLSYEEIQHLDPSKTTVVIDMSGNKRILSQLHKHLGENMALTLNVGITHWADLQDVSGIDQSRCEQFFAPGHIQSMIKEVGPQEFQAKSGTFVQGTAVRTRSWLQLKQLEGLSQLQTFYPDVMMGKLSAETGLIVSLSG